jgi:hypothetical protein
VDDKDIPDAPVHEDYEFKGWRTPEGELVTELKIEDVTSDLVYTAVYEPTIVPAPKDYEVTYVDSRTGEILKDETVYEHGSSIVPAPKEHEGYQFKGWRKPDGTIVQELTVEDVTSDLTFIALYDRVYEEAIGISRKIHYRYTNENGEEVQEDVTNYVRFTRQAIVDAVTGETTFTEWTPRFETYPKVISPEIEGFTPDRPYIEEQTVWPNGENEELWVIYKPVEYEEIQSFTRTVKYRYYTADGEEASADVVQTVQLKRTYTLDPVTKEKVYGPWVMTGSSQEAVSPEIDGFEADKANIPAFVPDLENPQDGEDEIVIYNKVEKTFTVTFVDGFGETLKVQKDVPEHGSAEAPDDPVHDGYVFTGWDVTFDDITGDVKVTAQWEKTRTVTYVDTDGTVHQKNVIGVDEGEPPAPKDLVKSGFIFDGWDREEDKDGNVVYTARWKKIDDPQPKSYWVTYVDEDGKIYIAKTTIDEGEKEPDAPKDMVKNGFVFDGWERTVDDEGNVTYTAKWKKAETPAEPSSTTAPTVPQGTQARTVTDPRSGNTVTIVTPDSTRGAGTGDTNNTFIWIIVAAAAAGAAITAVAVKRRKRDE